MPKSKLNSLERYHLAQEKVHTLLSKYDGNRTTILSGRAKFRRTKDEAFRQHHNDLFALMKFEKVIRDFEDCPQDPPETSIQNGEQLKQTRPFEKDYHVAQEIVRTLLSKYNGNRNSILSGRAIYRHTKDKEFQKYYSDYKTLAKYEKLIKQYHQGKKMPDNNKNYDNQHKCKTTNKFETKNDCKNNGSTGIIFESCNYGEFCGDENSSNDESSCNDILEVNNNDECCDDGSCDDVYVGTHNQCEKVRKMKIHCDISLFLQN